MSRSHYCRLHLCQCHTSAHCIYVKVTLMQIAFISRSHYWWLHLYQDHITADCIMSRSHFCRLHVCQGNTNADGIYLKVTVIILWLGHYCRLHFCQRSFHVYQRYINPDCIYVSVTLTADYTISLSHYWEFICQFINTKMSAMTVHWSLNLTYWCPMWIYSPNFQSNYCNRNTWEKLLICPHVTDNFCHIKLYQVPTSCHRQELNIQGYVYGV